MFFGVMTKCGELIVQMCVLYLPKKIVEIAQLWQNTTEATTLLQQFIKKKGGKSGFHLSSSLAFISFVLFVSWSYCVGNEFEKRQHLSLFCFVVKCDKNLCLFFCPPFSRTVVTPPHLSMLHHNDVTSRTTISF